MIDLHLIRIIELYGILQISHVLTEVLTEPVVLADCQHSSMNVFVSSDIKQEKRIRYLYSSVTV